MKVYIAGPMTGMPENNFPEFNRVEKMLTEAGFDAVNPARHGGFEDGVPWETCLRLALQDMLTCDAIYLLDGWEQSRGAKIEHDLAVTLKMHVLHSHTLTVPMEAPDARTT